MYPYRPGDYATLTRKYLGSLYWSTLTLTTIGDLPTPETNAEWVGITKDILLYIYVHISKWIWQIGWVSVLTFNYQFHQSDRTFRWTAHDQFRVVALNRAYFNLALAMGTIIINIQLWYISKQGQSNSANIMQLVWGLSTDSSALVFIIF